MVNIYPTTSRNSKYLQIEELGCLLGLLNGSNINKMGNKNDAMKRRKGGPNEV